MCYTFNGHPRPRLILARAILLFVSLLLFNAGSRAGVVVTYSDRNQAYFSITIPDSWRVNVGSDTDPAQIPEGEIPPPRVITVMPEDNSILWFGAWVPTYLHDLDAAQEYLSSLDDFLVEKPQLRKSDEVNLNDMPARYFTGQGEKEGVAVDFFVMLFQIAEETIGIAIYIGPPDSTAAHLGALRGMMKSIAPAGGS